MTQITGKVIERLVSVGSKSEHNAIIIQTSDNGELVLQREGGNPFHDDELSKLLGLNIIGNGTRVYNKFIMKDWTVV